MKTKIKKIEYGDGNCKYVAKWKLTFMEILKYDKLFYDQNFIPIIFFSIIFLPIIIPYAFTYKESEFDSLEEAKACLDMEIGYINELEEGRIKNKLSKKVVKTSIIKHP